MLMSCVWSERLPLVLLPGNAANLVAAYTIQTPSRRGGLG